jgi:hypothetical protein
MTQWYNSKTIPKRFKPNILSMNEKYEKKENAPWADLLKMILNMIPKKYKTMLGLSAIILLLGFTAWFILGCFGLMYMCHALFSLPFLYKDTNEIVIRIIRDAGLEVNDESLAEAAIAALEHAANAEL